MIFYGAQMMWLKSRAFILVSIFYMLGALSAVAEWRSEIGVFRVGVVTDDRSSGFTPRAEPFRLALQDALRMDVEFFTAKRPEQIIDALSSDRIEYAILSATGYALAWSVCECIEPVAAPRSSDGTDGYNLVLITHQDGPRDLKGLSGRNIGVLSAEGALEIGILKLALQEAGLVEEEISIVSDQSGETTLTSFLDRQYDALLGWSSLTGNPSEGYTRGTLQMIAGKTGGLATNYPVLWKSEQLAHRVHSVRKKLPGEAKNTIRNVLISMYERNPVAYDSIEPIYGGGFSTSRHSRYQAFIDVIDTLRPEKELEIELESTTQKEVDLNKENPPQ